MRIKISNFLESFLLPSSHPLKLGWLLAALALFVSCARPISIEKICPKYPILKSFKEQCYKKLQQFEGFICKHIDGKYYVCYDEKNNNAIGNNLEVLIQCIEVFDEEIKFYNNVIINGQDK